MLEDLLKELDPVVAQFIRENPSEELEQVAGFIKRRREASKPENIFDALPAITPADAGAVPAKAGELDLGELNLPSPTTDYAAYTVPQRPEPEPFPAPRGPYIPRGTPELEPKTPEQLREEKIAEQVRLMGKTWSEQTMEESAWQNLDWNEERDRMLKAGMSLEDAKQQFLRRLQINQQISQQENRSFWGDLLDDWGGQTMLAVSTLVAPFVTMARKGVANTAKAARLLLDKIVPDMKVNQLMTKVVDTMDVPTDFELYAKQFLASKVEEAAKYGGKDAAVATEYAERISQFAANYVAMVGMTQLVLGAISRGGFMKSVTKNLFGYDPGGARLGKYAAEGLFNARRWGDFAVTRQIATQMAFRAMLTSDATHPKEVLQDGMTAFFYGMTTFFASKLLAFTPLGRAPMDSSRVRDVFRWATDFILNCGVSMAGGPAAAAILGETGENVWQTSKREAIAIAQQNGDAPENWMRYLGRTMLFEDVLSNIVGALGAFGSTKMEAVDNRLADIARSSKIPVGDVVKILYAQNPLRDSSGKVLAAIGADGKPAPRVDMDAVESKILSGEAKQYFDDLAQKSEQERVAELKANKDAAQRVQDEVKAATEYLSDRIYEEVRNGADPEKPITEELEAEIRNTLGPIVKEQGQTEVIDEAVFRDEQGQPRALGEIADELGLVREDRSLEGAVKEFKDLQSSPEYQYQQKVVQYDRYESMIRNLAGSILGLKPEQVPAPPRRFIAGEASVEEIPAVPAKVQVAVGAIQKALSERTEAQRKDVVKAVMDRLKNEPDMRLKEADVLRILNGEKPELAKPTLTAEQKARAATAERAEAERVAEVNARREAPRPTDVVTLASGGKRVRGVVVKVEGKTLFVNPYRTTRSGKQVVPALTLGKETIEVPRDQAEVVKKAPSARQAKYVGKEARRISLGVEQEWEKRTRAGEREETRALAGKKALLGAEFAAKVAKGTMDMSKPVTKDTAQRIADMLGLQLKDLRVSRNRYKTLGDIVKEQKIKLDMPARVGREVARQLSKDIFSGKLLGGTSGKITANELAQHFYRDRWNKMSAAEQSSARTMVIRHVYPQLAKEGLLKTVSRGGTGADYRIDVEYIRKTFVKRTKQEIAKKKHVAVPDDQQVLPETRHVVRETVFDPDTGAERVFETPLPALRLTQRAAGAAVLVAREGITYRYLGRGHFEDDTRTVHVFRAVDGPDEGKMFAAETADQFIRKQDVDIEEAATRMNKERQKITKLYDQRVQELHALEKKIHDIVTSPNPDMKQVRSLRDERMDKEEELAKLDISTWYVRERPEKPRTPSATAYQQQHKQAPTDETLRKTAAFIREAGVISTAKNILDFFRLPVTEPDRVTAMSIANRLDRVADERFLSEKMTAEDMDESLRDFVSQLPSVQSADPKIAKNNLQRTMVALWRLMDQNSETGKRPVYERLGRASPMVDTLPVSAEEFDRGAGTIPTVELGGVPRLEPHALRVLTASRDELLSSIKNLEARLPALRADKEMPELARAVSIRTASENLAHFKELREMTQRKIDGIVRSQAARPGNVSDEYRTLLKESGYVPSDTDTFETLGPEKISPKVKELLGLGTVSELKAGDNDAAQLERYNYLSRVLAAWGYDGTALTQTAAAIATDRDVSAYPSILNRLTRGVVASGLTAPGKTVQAFRRQLSVSDMLIAYGEPVSSREALSERRKLMRHLDESIRKQLANIQTELADLREGDRVVNREMLQWSIRAEFEELRDQIKERAQIAIDTVMAQRARRQQVKQDSRKSVAALQKTLRKTKAQVAKIKAMRPDDLNRRTWKRFMSENASFFENLDTTIKDAIGFTERMETALSDHLAPRVNQLKLELAALSTEKANLIQERNNRRGTPSAQEMASYATRLGELTVQMAQKSEELKRLSSVGGQHVGKAIHEARVDVLERTLEHHVIAQLQSRTTEWSAIRRAAKAAVKRLSHKYGKKRARVEAEYDKLLDTIDVLKRAKTTAAVATKQAAINKRIAELRPVIESLNMLPMLRQLAKDPLPFIRSQMLARLKREWIPAGDITAERGVVLREIRDVERKAEELARIVPQLRTIEWPFAADRVEPAKTLDWNGFREEFGSAIESAVIPQTVADLAFATGAAPPKADVKIVAAREAMQALYNERAAAVKAGKPMAPEDIQRRLADIQKRFPVFSRQIGEYQTAIERGASQQELDKMFDALRLPAPMKMRETKYSDFLKADQKAAASLGENWRERLLQSLALQADRAASSLESRLKAANDALARALGQKPDVLRADERATISEMRDILRKIDKGQFAKLPQSAGVMRLQQLVGLRSLSPDAALDASITMLERERAQVTARAEEAFDDKMKRVVGLFASQPDIRQQLARNALAISPAFKDAIRQELVDRDAQAKRQARPKLSVPSDEARMRTMADDMAAEEKMLARDLLEREIKDLSGKLAKAKTDAAAYELSRAITQRRELLSRVDEVPLRDIARYLGTVRRQTNVGENRRFASTADMHQQLLDVLGRAGTVSGGVWQKDGDAVTATLRTGLKLEFVARDSADTPTIRPVMDGDRLAGYRIEVSLKNNDMATIPHEVLGHIGWDALADRPNERRVLLKFLGRDPVKTTDELAAIEIGRAYAEGRSVGALGTYVRRVWDKVCQVMSAVRQLNFKDAWQRIREIPNPLYASRGRSILNAMLEGKHLHVPIREPTRGIRAQSDLPIGIVGMMPEKEVDKAEFLKQRKNKGSRFWRWVKARREIGINTIVTLKTFKQFYEETQSDPLVRQIVSETADKAKRVAVVNSDHLVAPSLRKETAQSADVLKEMVSYYTEPIQDIKRFSATLADKIKDAGDFTDGKIHEFTNIGRALSKEGGPVHDPYRRVTIRLYQETTTGRKAVDLDIRLDEQMAMAMYFKAAMAMLEKAKQEQPERGEMNRYLNALGAFVIEKSVRGRLQLTKTEQEKGLGTVMFAYKTEVDPNASAAVKEQQLNAKAEEIKEFYSQLEDSLPPEAKAFIGEAAKLTAQIGGEVKEVFERVNPGTKLNLREWYLSMMRDVSFMGGTLARQDTVDNPKTMLEIMSSDEYVNHLNNRSFLKRVTWSDAPVLIRGISEVLTRHINGAAQYIGGAEANKLMLHLFGRRQGTGVAMFRAAVSRVVGEQALDQITSYARSFASPIGPVEASKIERFASRVLGTVTTARLISIGVGLKQHASRWAAAVFLGPDALMHERSHPVTKEQEEAILERVGYFRLRKDSAKTEAIMQSYPGEGQGFEFFGTTRSTDTSRNVLRRRTTAIRETMQRWAGKWLAMNDYPVMKHIMGMAIYRVEKDMPNLKPGTDAYYDAVAKLARDAAIETQVATSRLFRSNLQNQAHFFMRALTYMSGARIKQWNVLRHQYLELQDAKAMYGEGDETQRLRAKFAAAVFFAGAMQAAHVAMVSTGVKLGYEALSGTLWDDDDDELFVKTGKMVAWEFARAATGAAPMVNVVDAMSQTPLTSNSEDLKRLFGALKTYTTLQYQYQTTGQLKPLDRKRMDRALKRAFTITARLYGEMGLAINVRQVDKLIPRVILEKD